MPWRCVNDKTWGYCKGEPDWTEPNSSEVQTCKKDPKTCGNYETLTEQLKRKGIIK